MKSKNTVWHSTESHYVPTTSGRLYLYQSTFCPLYYLLLPALKEDTDLTVSEEASVFRGVLASMIIYAWITFRMDYSL
jgi:hypothetical protein